LRASRPTATRPGNFFRRSLHKLGVAHRRGADDDARNAFRQPGLDGLQIADAAAELHRHGDRLEHRLDGMRVHRLAGKGAVKIDHVQVFEHLRSKTARLRRRIEIEHGRARHVALFEAHALAVLQVDGGKQDHGMLPAPSALAGRGIAYDRIEPRVDAIVVLHNLSAGRPCERRDPSPLASM